MFLKIVNRVIVMIFKILFVSDNMVIIRFLPFEFWNDDLVLSIFLDELVVEFINQLSQTKATRRRVAFVTVT